MKSIYFQNAFFVVLLIGVLVVTFFIFLPYLNALILAGVLAALFRPLFRLFLKGLKNESLAAILTLLIVLIVIISPLFFFGKQVVKETTDLYFSVVDGNRITPLDTVSRFIENGISSILPDYSGQIDINLKQYAEVALTWIIEHFGNLFSKLAQFGLLIFVSLIAFYYFLKDGTRIKRTLIDLSPLANSYDEEIFNRLYLAVNSVIRGSLTIALIQGVLTGFGFWIFGVPSSALWGGIAMITALIPGIGTALVLIPGILYLFIIGSAGNALGLLIWGALAVGLIDNFLGPRLVSRRINIHELIILLSVLGGIALFGPIGFVMGPLVLSLLVALLDIYKTLILQEKGGG